GMTLLSALGKINVGPESVIATRAGDMILDDEILKDGDEIKLIAVISGGACRCEERSDEATPTNDETSSPLGIASLLRGSQRQGYNHEM
ncbi:MAG: MoaD/ThiS family protein, partial [Chloroflexota bacterium]